LLVVCLLVYAERLCLFQKLPPVLRAGRAEREDLSGRPESDFLRDGRSLVLFPLTLVLRFSPLKSLSISSLQLKDF
jgi:hypothetical protein